MRMKETRQKKYQPITRLIYFPLSSLSVAIIVAALAGPQWLFTEEKLSKQQLNATIYFKPRGDDSDYITKFTKSSLWILCTVLGRYNTIKLSIASYLYLLCFVDKLQI